MYTKNVTTISYVSVHIFICEFWDIAKSINLDVNKICIIKKKTHTHALNCGG